MVQRSSSVSDVTLQEVTASTLPDQESYVCSNAVSIAQAHFYPEAWFGAVYAARIPVGFVMLRDLTRLEPLLAQAPLSVWRLMIDRNSRAAASDARALELVVAHACTRPGVDALYTSYLAGEQEPRNFYLMFGFRATARPKRTTRLSWFWIH